MIIIMVLKNKVNHKINHQLKISSTLIITTIKIKHFQETITIIKTTMHTTMHTKEQIKKSATNSYAVYNRSFNPLNIN